MQIHPVLNKVVASSGRTLKRAGFLHPTASPQVRAMQRRIQTLKGGIQFKIEFYPDGSWTAESTNVDGIITGGKDKKEMSAILKDAIFTYFEIPPHLCDTTVLRADNEPVTVTQRVYA